MDTNKPLPGARDKLLFTPGPLSTSATVKQAMLRDLGSRDTEFIARVRRIRERLLALGGVAAPAFEAVLLQGSGTYALEAVAATFTPREGTWLVASNGAYGRRFSHIAVTLGAAVIDLDCEEDTRVDPAAVAAALDENPAVSHVAVVHCETTSGILNPVAEVGAVCRERGKRLFVDAMSSFGAIPLDLEAAGVDYLASSANKCIEGVPGFAFVLVRGEALAEAEGRARSVCLDLRAQWQGLERNGQFRFTPPTHTLLAFDRALDELEQEGGVQGRGARYRANHGRLVQGMRSIGFKEYLRSEDQGPIITSFRYPTHPAWDFEAFYHRLSERGAVIYPGKVGAADCFRIGSIGRIFPADVDNLLTAIREVLAGMDVTLTTEDAR